MCPWAQRLPAWSWLSGEPVSTQPGICVPVPAGAQKAPAWDLVSGAADRVRSGHQSRSLMFSFLSPQHSIRALALRVLREILRNQPARFKNYAELTIMKTLEAHKDSHKEVSRVRVYTHPMSVLMSEQRCRAHAPAGAHSRASTAVQQAGPPPAVRTRDGRAASLSPWSPAALGGCRHMLSAGVLGEMGTCGSPPPWQHAPLCRLWAWWQRCLLHQLPVVRNSPCWGSHSSGLSQTHVSGLGLVCGWWTVHALSSHLLTCPGTCYSQSLEY